MLKDSSLFSVTVDVNYLGQAFPLLREREGALGQEHGRDYGVPCPGQIKN